MVGHATRFPTRHQFESRSDDFLRFAEVRVRITEKNFEVVMGSNPALGTLLSTFASVTGSIPVAQSAGLKTVCSTAVPLLFHGCSTSVGSTVVERRGLSLTRGTAVEQPWNTRGSSPRGDPVPRLFHAVPRRFHGCSTRVHLTVVEHRGLS